jgi:TPR repeat protein
MSTGGPFLRGTTAKDEISRALAYSVRAGVERVTSTHEAAIDAESGKNPDLDHARELYLRSAGDGSPFAMYRLARFAELYPSHIGHHVAFEWAEKSAHRDYAPGLFALARLYEVGIGTAVDLDKALRLYRRSAEGGFGPAAAHLALVFELGIWGTRNHELASSFAGLAASLGMASAAQMLGRAYEDGNGVPRNDVLAIAWYTKAAEGGDAVAALRLAMAYSLGGLGVRPDRQKAEHFTRISDTHGRRN